VNHPGKSVIRLLNVLLLMHTIEAESPLHSDRLINALSYLPYHHLNDFKIL